MPTKPQNVTNPGAAIAPAALKAKPAAAYISISLPTLYRLVDRGLLKPNRATRHLLFPVKMLDEFLAR